jgi:hypothetical protein
VVARHFNGRATPLLAALACVSLLTACSYDLDRLRGNRDAATDLQRVDSADDALDQTPPDANEDDSPTDTVDRDARSDTPVAPLLCTSRSAPSVVDVGTRVGGTYRVTGDTTGEPSLLMPPNTPQCSFGSGTNPSPERVYRYTVQEGPRLYANTDAAACAGAFDTVLYARTSCDVDVGTDLGCDDDDHVLTSCGSPASLGSGLLLGNLSPGDVVFLVIDGYNGNAGPFRLNVTENGLYNAEPTSDFSLSPADACSCPSSLDSMQHAVMFPDSTDRMRNASGSSLTALNRAGDRLVGTHALTFTNIAGAALEFRLSSNGLCAGASAVLDLVIDGQAVAAFYVDDGARPGTTQRMALQTFGTIGNSATTSVELRLRGITPSSCTTPAGLAFDTATPGTLTLLGRP